MSEWIKHTGTKNPVPGTVVEVYLKSGSSFVENSEDLNWWLQNTDGSILFYRTVNVNNKNSSSNTTFNESIPKDALKLVLVNALKNRKSLDSLYADLIELL